MKGSAHIYRYNPLIDREARFQDYSFTYFAGMTALDVLNQIYEQQDATLAYSACCRSGHCGICGALVNGRSALLCKCPATQEITLEPLHNFPVQKDLIVDRSSYEEHRAALRLFLEREHEYEESAPEPVSLPAFEKFKVASRCIECYCCVSECPSFAKNPHGFAGPAAIALEARHAYDPRDEQNRSLILKSMGLAACIECGKCSKVCPHGVDPLGIIRDLRHSKEN